MANIENTILRLGTRVELTFWAEQNGYVLEDFPGGLYMGEYQINLDTNDYILSVESRLDEPQSL